LNAIAENNLRGTSMSPTTEEQTKQLKQAVFFFKLRTKEEQHKGRKP